MEGEANVGNSGKLLHAGVSFNTELTYPKPRLCPPLTRSSPLTPSSFHPKVSSAYLLSNLPKYSFRVSFGRKRRRCGLQMKVLGPADTQLQNQVSRGLSTQVKVGLELRSGLKIGFTEQKAYIIQMRTIFRTVVFLPGIYLDTSTVSPSLTVGCHPGEWEILRLPYCGR